MKTVGLFEAKTRLSELCREIAESGEPILIERRGTPIAELVPPRRQSPASRSILDDLARFNAANPPAADEPDFPEVWLERSPPASASPLD